MKKCRTVNGLLRAIEQKEAATLVIWGIMDNAFDPKGAYLNLGQGSYSYVGEKNWKIIRNQLVTADGEYYKNRKKEAYYYTS